MGADDVGADASRVAALERRVEELLGVVRRLDDEVASLRARPTPPEPGGATADDGSTAASIPPPASTSPAPLGRRQLLLGGGAAAAAGTVALVAGTPSPAAAAGQPLLLNADNAATSVTTVHASQAERDDFVLLVEQGGSGSGLGASSGTAIGVSGQTNTGIAVSGQALAAPGDDDLAIGVYGSAVAGGTGVRGDSVDGPAVAGAASGTGAGVSGESAGGPGGVFASNVANLWLRVSSHPRNAPTTDTRSHANGELIVDDAGDLWFCALSGSPGTFRKVSGYSTAGSLHLLPTPVRVYDSRPGTSPATAPKAKLAAGVARTLDCTANRSGVPKDAAGVLVTLLVVNAASGSGNLTIWAAGATRPAANNMVWGGTAGRFSSLAVSALGPNGTVDVMSSVATDFVLDVTGFYR